jgi:hypothetical protein
MPAPTKNFTTFADSAVDPDSPIDTALMTGLRDNDIHVREWIGVGYTAAQNHDHDNVNSKPVVGVADGTITTLKIADANVTQAKIGSGAVGQAQLKTTTGDMTITGVNPAESSFTGPGGEYGFWPSVYDDSNSSIEHMVTAVSLEDGLGALLAETLPTTFTNRFHLARRITGVNNMVVRQRYIQASPPYDMGDGEVPLFIFAVVSSLGEIEACWSAPDPVWANNGPTDIRPDFTDRSGTQFQMVRDISPALMARLANRATRVTALIELSELPLVPREVTQAVKQADMPLIPHPFLGNNLTGKTIVLLDPVAVLMVKLRELHATGESINLLLHEDYLRIGNTPLVRAGPPGVIVVAVSWKLT